MDCHQEERFFRELLKKWEKVVASDIQYFRFQINHNFNEKTLRINSTT